MQYFLDKSVQVKVFDAESSFAGIGEHLSGQIGGPCCSLLNSLQVLGGRRLPVDVQECEIGVAEDCHQKVVEIMSDAACQYAEAFKFLGLE